MNATLAAVPPSIIRAIHALKRPGDLDLGLGEPVLRPDPEPFSRAAARVAAEGCPYSPNAGLPRLRALIAARHGYAGLTAPESVCVTVGSQEALYLAVKALADPALGDELLVVTPAYPAYAKIAQLEGLAVREVSLDPDRGFAPDAERVLAAVGPRTRLVVIASPANPTGRVWPELELDALAAGLSALSAGRERPIAVIWDEVYRELVYGGAVPAPSLAGRYPHTFVAGSLSKSHALTGLRLGWLMGEPAAMAAVVKLHQFVATAASTYSQYVAEEILADTERYPAHREAYAEAREALGIALARHGLEAAPVEGAFYALIRLKGSGAEAGSLAFCKRLIEARRVLSVPGAAFGAEGWVRISWVAPPEAVERGLAAIAAALTEA